MLLLPHGPPIDPHPAHLPLLVEQHGVAHVSRLKATEPVINSQDLSRDGRGGLDCREWGEAHLLYGACDRDIQGEG